jgi:hypothetical protein
MSYVVTQRTREISARLALGAEPASVARMVVRQGGLVALAGIAIGLATALAGSLGLQAAALDAMGDEVIWITPTPRGLSRGPSRDLTRGCRTRPLVSPDAPVRHKPMTADAARPLPEHAQMLASSAAHTGGPFYRASLGQFSRALKGGGIPCVWLDSGGSPQKIRPSDH